MVARSVPTQKKSTNPHVVEVGQEFTGVEVGNCWASIRGKKGVKTPADSSAPGFDRDRSRSDSQKMEPRISQRPLLLC